MVVSDSKSRTNDVIRSTVRKVNSKTGKAAVIVESGNYVIIEVPHIVFEPGDIISGDLHSVGAKIVRNDTREELLHVYVQEIDVTPERAEQLVS
jgi:hypothetical protein